MLLQMARFHSFLWLNTHTHNVYENAHPSPTLCDPIDCSLPGSSVHGILQARILEWVAIPFSGGSFQPRDWAQVSCIAERFFTIWNNREYIYYIKFSSSVICWWTLRLSFHVLAILNNVTMNMRIQIRFQSMFSFSLCKSQAVKLMGHVVVLFLIFWETSVLFP